MIKESRVRKGQLTIGTSGGGSFLDVSCQATSVKLSPDFEESDESGEVLCGDSFGSSATATKWKLAFTGIQDFDDPAGFVMFAFDHNGATLPFTWKPNDSATAHVWSGMVEVRALEVGGDVAARLTTDAEWPASGVTHTAPAKTEPAKTAAKD